MNQEHAAHVLGYTTLLLVWLALVVLTILTVAISRIDLGALNILAALGIACTKASLVIAFFMHMKYERTIFRVFLMIALVTLAIFIGFTFFDVLYR